MNIVWLALITGLTTGGLSCFAVQGGLLSGTLANQSRSNQKKSLLMFLSGKTFAHFLLGGFLGSLGSALIISPNTQGVIQILAGFFIIFVALKLADISPFNKVGLAPPKTFLKIVRINSKNQNLFTPLIIGLLTILIPCGTTQAIMLLSISSGSFLWGSLILSSFVLGTTPVFFLLGIASEKILSIKTLKIFAVSLITFLGLFSINSGQILRGSNHTFQNYKKATMEVFGISKTEVLGASAKIGPNGKQEVTINAHNTSYTSDTTTLKAGVPVRLTLKTDNTRGCSRAFTLPEYNISRVLPATGEEVIEFTPTKTGNLTYSCSMGMYTGSFNVVD